MYLYANEYPKLLTFTFAFNSKFWSNLNNLNDQYTKKIIQTWVEATRHETKVLIFINLFEYENIFVKKN